MLMYMYLIKVLYLEYIKDSMCCGVLSNFNCAWLFVIPWTVAYQTPLFMGFSRQEFWSELSCPSPGNLLKPGIEPTSNASLALFSYKKQTTLEINAQKLYRDTSGNKICRWANDHMKRQCNSSLWICKLKQQRIGKRSRPGWLRGKESICNAGDAGLTSASGRSLEEVIATQASILAWRILWTEEPGGLQLMESHRVGHDWVSTKTIKWLKLLLIWNSNLLIRV